MTKVKAMLCVCFILAFAAGICVGLLAGRSARGARRGSWLSGELNLSAAQREQMRAIWSGVMSASREGQSERRQALRDEHEQAIQALLSEEQKRQYDQLTQEYAGKLDELSQERRKRFEEAAERTKELLTEQQRRKYEELMERRPRSRHGSGRGRERGGGDRLWSRPSDEE